MLLLVLDCQLFVALEVYCTSSEFAVQGMEILTQCSHITATRRQRVLEPLMLHRSVNPQLRHDGLILLDDVPAVPAI